jgi:hypothetical protein
MGKSFSFHEQTSIIVPGATLVFGLLFFFPDFRQLFFSNGVSLGGLGLFLLISYAAGHLAAALGNLIEACLWQAVGGRPANWITQKDGRILSIEQVRSVEQLVRDRLRLDIGAIAGMPTKQWFPISRQIHADVMAHGKSGRLDSLGGNYALNRGLAAALLAVIMLSLAFSEAESRYTLGLLPIALVYLYRMYRFGVSQAAELYAQFLVLPAQPPIPRRPSNITRLPIS